MPKILLVEDDEMNWDMLSRRLQKSGYEVARAGDGEEACTKASTEHPDLILMDCKLPVLDGWEATRRLKAAPPTHAIPVIALTAQAYAEDRATALAAGCDDFVSKPIDFKLLLAKIQALLQPRTTP